MYDSATTTATTTTTTTSIIFYTHKNINNNNWKNMYDTCHSHKSSNHQHLLYPQQQHQEYPKHQQQQQRRLKKYLIIEISRVILFFKSDKGKVKQSLIVFSKRISQNMKKIIMLLCIHLDWKWLHLPELNFFLLLKNTSLLTHAN